MQKLLFCMPLIMIHLLTAIININQPTFYNPIKFQWVKSSPILFCTKYSNAAECVVNSVSAFNGCRIAVRSTVTESNEERRRRAYVRMQYFYFSEQSKHTDTIWTHKRRVYHSPHPLHFIERYESGDDEKPADEAFADKTSRRIKHSQCVNLTKPVKNITGSYFNLR